MTRAAVLMLIAAAVLIASTPTHAQVLDWARRMGGTGIDFAKSIAVDSAGSVYTAGSFTDEADFDPSPQEYNRDSAGILDAFVSKLDAAGNFVWAARMGGDGTDGAFGVALDAAGNVYTVGHFSGVADFDPGPGTFNLTSDGGVDAFVSKLNSAGNFVWARRLGGTEPDQAAGVALDAAGNVHTVGLFVGTADFDPGVGTANLTSSGAADVFVSKLNSAGNFVWARRLGGTEQDLAGGIALDGGGNVYTVGTFEGTADFNPGAATSDLDSAGDKDVFVSKLTSLGFFVWARRMGGADADAPNAVALDSAGNVVTVGTFAGIADFNPSFLEYELDAAGDTDAFVSKLDSSGNFVWARGMGGAQATEARAVALDGTGAVYTSGGFQGTTDFDPGPGTYYLTPASGFDVFVSKLNSAGTFVWARKVGGTEADAGQAVAFAGGSIYPAGHFNGTVDFDPGPATFNLTSSNPTDIFVFRLFATPVELRWLLRNTNSVGNPSVTAFEYGAGGDVPVAGDWDGDGDATIGVVRPNTATGAWRWRLRNTNSAGNASVAFDFGVVSTDIPVVGDWDGDGDTTIGVVRPNGAAWRWRLRNTNSAGNASLAFDFGTVATDIPVVGDWDGDGDTTIGVVRLNSVTDNWRWRLRNTNSAGSASLAFDYGAPWHHRPVVGDWDGDGDTTIGVAQTAPATGHWRWHLRNTNSEGNASLSFDYGGIRYDRPIVGDWDGDGDTTIGVVRIIQ